jgi:endoglucanase
LSENHTLDRVLAAFSALFCFSFLFAPLSHASMEYTGVNLSGAEFGQTNLPGTFGTDYTYPTDAEVDYFVGKGMNTFRLPFRWERLQNSQNAALNAAELSRMTSFVNYATSQGANVILDPHNFARYFPSPASNFQGSTTGVVGGDVPDSSFANFWSQVAADFKNNSHVIFNLMNEPANLNTDQWVGAANAAIAAIRATGATNLILVPGNRFTGAWTWDTSDANGRSNADAMLDIVDPGNNFAFDVHQYFDSDGSGTHSSILGNNPMLGVQRLTDFTNWLDANNRRGFLGEFAVDNIKIGDGPSQVGDELVTNMLNYMSSDPNWLGWTWWGGGPWWSTNSLFHIDPVDGVDENSMTMLEPFLAGVPEPTPAMLAGLLCCGLCLPRPRRACVRAR